MTISTVSALLLLGMLASCGGNEDTITVYTEAGFAPYEFIYNNEIVGVDIAIVKAVAEELGQPLAVIDGSGSALELLTDAAQLIDELGRLADVIVSIGNFLERRLELCGKVGSAETAIVAVGIGIIAKIGAEIHVGGHIRGFLLPLQGFSVAY